MDLHPIDIVIHIVNIVILYVVLRLLVYKPVFKFMQERKARIQKDLQDAQQAKLDAEASRAEFANILDNAEAQAQDKVVEITGHANEQAEEIVSKAQVKAKEIVEQAHKKAEADKADTIAGMQNEIADLAVGIAQKILDREVSEADNDAIITEFFAQKN